MKTKEYRKTQIAFVTSVWLHWMSVIGMFVSAITSIGGFWPFVLIFFITKWRNSHLYTQLREIKTNG